MKKEIFMAAIFHSACFLFMFPSCVHSNREFVVLQCHLEDGQLNFMPHKIRLYLPIPGFSNHQIK